MEKGRWRTEKGDLECWGGGGRTHPEKMTLEQRLEGSGAVSLEDSQERPFHTVRGVGAKALRWEHTWFLGNSM